MADAILRLSDTKLAEEQLLAALAAAPAGEKLSIPRLRDALLCQADLLDMLQRLVWAGAIDRATLRPSGSRPVKAGEKQGGAEPSPPPSCDKAVTKGAPASSPGPIQANRGPVPPALRPSGKQLFRRLIEEGEARGMSASAVSKAAFGGPAQMSVMKAGAKAVQAKTLAKAEAWLATPRPAPPPPPPAKPEPEAKAPAPPQKTGGELADALMAVVSAHELSKTQVSVHLFNGMKGGIEQLRRRKRLKPATVERIEAFLADPPIAALKRKRAAPVPRDPTSKPETPMMDRADQRDRQNARVGAQVNRSNAAAAEKLLNGEKTPSGAVSPAVRAAANQIQSTREAQARQTDPVEAAKLALQRKGLTVYSASVTGGRKDRFIVSGQQNQLTPAELIGLAERRTGQSFRRVA